jgi:small glutamine-rich tetratricopeptide repeat-containing protein alpha
MQTGLRNSEANAKAADAVGDVPSPSAASSNPQMDPSTGGMGGLAETLRNMGGGGAGGTPDLAGLMNNPAMMQMAQQMMANGGLERLMSNPAVANMVSCIESMPMELPYSSSPRCRT